MAIPDLPVLEISGELPAVGEVKVESLILNSRQSRIEEGKPGHSIFSFKKIEDITPS